MKQLIKSKILTSFIVIIILLIFSFFLVVHLTIESNILTEANLKKDSINKFISHSIEKSAEALKCHLQMIEYQTDLIELWQKQDRQLLYDRSLKYFNNMKSEHNITHFYFINPDKKSFLRVHTKDRYGDTIQRYTLDTSVKLNSLSYGIELGPYGTLTLRSVKPVYKDNQLIGYLELGIEIENMTKIIKKTLNVETAFLIIKTHLVKSKWEEGLKFLNRNQKWDLLKDFVVIESTINIHGNILNKENRDLFYGFSTVELDGKNYYKDTIPLKDVSGKEIGVIINLFDLSDIENLINNATAIIILIFMVAGFISYKIFYKIVNNLELKLFDIYICLEKEIENRKRNEEALEQANMVKERFISNMSHELRTPLNAVIGFSELMTANETSEDKKGMLKNIFMAGKHLLGIVTDILDLTKFMTDKMVMTNEKIKLRSLIIEVINLIKPKTDQKKIKFEYFFEINMVDELIGDPTRIKQILINLLDNAIKYTQKGSISLAADSRFDEHEKKEIVKFKISDTGIGIPPEKISDIFKPFFQLDDSLSKSYSGLGLGLGIVKQIVDYLGGKISVKSELGVGSIFEVEIGFETFHSGTAEMMSNNIDEYYKMLLVEDDITMHLLLNKLSEKYGTFKVKSVQNCYEAVEILNTEKINLLLIDSEEYEREGRKLSKILLNQKDNKRFKKILFLSDDDKECAMQKTLNINFDDFITKPLDVNKLIDLIKKETQKLKIDDRG